MINFILPPFFIILLLFLYIQTNEIVAPRFEPLGSAFFPRLIISLMIFLNLILIIKSFIIIRRRKEFGRNVSSDSYITLQKIKYILATIFLFSLYILFIGMTDIHYLLLTFLFISILSWFLSLGKNKAFFYSIITGFVVTSVIYLIFGNFLNVFFP